MTEKDIRHLEDSIQCNQEFLQDEMKMLNIAHNQLKQHFQELNIRKKAVRARETIDYLEKKFIPDTQERIELIKRCIEISKLQLAGLTYEEAERQLDENTGQITIEDLAV
ncbi:hypothetical protein P9G84_22245 [Brevibacillus centrosporus]|uniref:hypothetical protein n=1 Tax=Brevibacillus centrosporus TaxID=54910 RepID=UPI000F09D6D5|nr:hypothetical protein [Brevibacillus centrosporus]MEC2131649.1 hypothetical protein [Brevibacillus centrosporus]RNB63271.1 hypothetical protein EDM55_29240 [Brevibacillus centrosporus]GED34983.1 hypothetical protein BCE02nite_61240 [Brevibacillus centrosporus]